MALIRTIPLALAVLFAPAAMAQIQVPIQVQDPANLTGEHIAPQALADTLPINQGVPALQQLLLKLRSRASLMLIVAHPDDEDGGMLTFESRGLGARVANLTLTRGEGGQNLMSADFDDALGLIRTQELLAADRYFGVDQFFGTEVDFGFSKTKEETLSKWTHDRVLYDAVRCVRLYRPLVVASVFVGGVTDGHGHHQVAGEIAQEVFVAAADPKVFPEMGLPPWAPLKVYARVPFSRVTREGMYDYATGKSVPPLFRNYVTGKDSTTPPEATVLIHEGDRSSAPGMDGDSYVQFARKGLALQKTQIGANARLAPSGRSDTGYTLMGSRACNPSPCPIHPDSGMSGIADANPTAEQSFFDTIDTSLPGLADLAPDANSEIKVVLKVNLAGLDRDVAEAQMQIRPEHPELAARTLRNALVGLDSLIGTLEQARASALPADEQFNLLHELRIKRVQLNRALTLALGITVDASVVGGDGKAPQPLVPGRPLVARATIHSASPVQVGSAVIQIPGHAPFAAQPIASPTLVSPSAPVTLTFEDRLPADTPVTRPFFARPGIDQPTYTLSVDALRNAPATPAPLVAVVRILFEGVAVEVQAVVHAPTSEPTATLQAANIVPALSVAVAPAAGIVALMPSPFALSAATRSNVPHTEARVNLAVPAGWKAESANALVMLDRPGSHAMVPFTIRPARIESEVHYTLTAVASIDTGNRAQQFSEGLRPVGYQGLTYTNLYEPATYRATAVDVTTAPGLRIAYLPGTGDNVPDYMPNLGVTPTLISVADLSDLGKYDAVILGVRAYAAHRELAGTGSKPLLDYARNGGVVIDQYMTAGFGDAESPFPIDVPGDPAHNVVEEAQPVTLLDPAAALLNWPNKITSADFDHWVAERGHGFAASWGPDFKPLLETHDPDQDPQKGGLLIAPVGKGAYIYCALALYRQLPESVPGAYRLLANLLSYAKNPRR